ncbi:hypothetical protein [Kitasatospora viridis]|uniref:Uncharacterized protein n=1 Tax=Kitasatospora viridis TaxID=281105 RepID=A0A561S9Y9_9ACTN|nr:hypothetical protein [Kitasatospora viridis]TWF71692.1 hypothetical protein FHX73_1863 [Kitasatospora viridis]
MRRTAPVTLACSTTVAAAAEGAFHLGVVTLASAAAAGIFTWITLTVTGGADHPDP